MRTGPSFHPPRPTATDPAEDARLMLSYGIVDDGRRYRLQGYRYDRLADAVNHARLLRLRPELMDPAVGPASARPAEVPTGEQRVLMAILDVRCERGVYVVGPFRYDRLVDALRHAHQRAGQPEHKGVRH